MIKNVTIKKVYQDTTKADGSPKVYGKGKNMGKPFTTVSIIVDGVEGIYKSHVMEGDRALKIAEGDTLVLRLDESTSADGKVHKNFSFPTKKEMEVYDQFNS